MPNSKRDQTGDPARPAPAPSHGGSEPEPPPHDDHAERGESEIDGILAASFPASDPPPWTLGREHDDEE